MHYRTHCSDTNGCSCSTAITQKWYVYVLTSSYFSINILGKLGSCMYICSKVKSDDKSFGLKCRASQFVAPVNNDYEINTNLKNFAEMKKNSV